MQTDGWQPGPPPLDTPGSFYCVNGADYHLILTVRDRAYWAQHWPRRPQDTASVKRGIVWHFPIPDPPETAQ